jgi:hypothetical protein
LLQLTVQAQPLRRVVDTSGMAVSAVRASVIFPGEADAPGVCVDVKSTFTLDVATPVEEVPRVGPIGPLCGGNRNGQQEGRERGRDQEQGESKSEGERAAPCITVIWA